MAKCHASYHDDKKNTNVMTVKESDIFIRQGAQSCHADQFTIRRLMVKERTGALSGRLRREHLAHQNRKHLLQRVRTIWIEGLLEHSLHQEVLLTLGLHEQPDAIENPWDLAVQEVGQEEHTLPMGTQIVDVYNNTAGELLILGEPGAGKTTLLLELARELLQRAEAERTYPMPTVFNLSSWAENQPLADWLVEELLTKYQVPRKVGRLWIEDDQLLLLLDGLDEVPQASRSACVQAINTYRQEHNLVPIVLCSRKDAYQALATRVLLHAAVAVQPLTSEQIDDYLAGPQLVAVRASFHEDQELQELVRTPLMLSILALAYQGQDVDNLITHVSPDMQRDHLFEVYVERMLRRRGASQYVPDQIKHWLTWLAQQMKQHSQTEHYLERMQMNWVPVSWLRRLLPSIVVGLVYGLFFGSIKGIDYAFMSGPDFYGNNFGPTRGLMDGVLIGIVNALLFAFLNGFVFGILGQRARELEASGTSGGWRRKLISILEMRPVYGFLMGLCNGLLITALVGPLAGALNGLFIGLVYAALGRLDPEIHPAERVTWSWIALRQNVATIIGAGMLIGLFYGLFTGLYWVIKGIQSAIWLLPCLLFGLSIGFVFGLIIVLFRGLSHNKLDQRNILKPNQGIWNSAKNSALLGLLCSLLFGLFFGVIYGELLQAIFQGFAVPVKDYMPYFPMGLIIGVANGLAVGAFVWARSGGIACVQHLVLRILLWHAKCTPRKYPHFLDDMAERLLLCKIGGGYVFIHRLLLDYFAALDYPLIGSP